MNQPASIVPPDVLHQMIGLAVDVPIEGNFVEIGVYQGGTAWHLLQIAKSQHRTLHLFDTFTGIPHFGPNDRHRPGDFSDVNLDAIRESLRGAVFHVGTFPETMTLDVGPVAFVHLDCDQEKSVMDGCVQMWPHVIPDGIIYCDDYFDLIGAKLAFNRFARFIGAEVRLTPSGRGYIVK